MPPFNSDDEQADQLARAKAAHFHYVSKTMELSANFQNLTVRVRRRADNIVQQNIASWETLGEVQRLNEDIKAADRLLAHQKIYAPSGFWVEFLGPADKTGDFLSNLAEIFEERWVPKYGKRRAKLIWYSQSLQFVVRYWMGYVIEAMKLWPTSS